MSGNCRSYECSSAAQSLTGPRARFLTSSSMDLKPNNVRKACDCRMEDLLAFLLKRYIDCGLWEEARGAREDEMSLNLRLLGSTKAEGAALIRGKPGSCWMAGKGLSKPAKQLLVIQIWLQPGIASWTAMALTSNARRGSASSSLPCFAS